MVEFLIDERPLNLVVINSLIDLRNNLISQGMYTDLVDELLIRISKAKAKKIKIKEV